MITNWFQQELPSHFTTQILMTLSEIQELLYLPDNKRNPVTILRLIITTYKHAMFLKTNIDGNIQLKVAFSFSVFVLRLEYRWNCSVECLIMLW